MHPNAALIRTLYDGLGARDHRAMAACYAPDATFDDPVFPGLAGARVTGMWHMLCERGKDLRVESSNITADDHTGTGHVEAWYTFSATGRKVHNVIDGTFRFEGGRIISHRDSFDFYRWARQALGLKGVLLGWTPLVRNAVRAQAAKSLDSFMKKHGGHAAG